MSSHTFGTVINCMDGRVQTLVSDWLKNKYGFEYVDTITEPGPERILALHTDEHAVQSIKDRVEISVSKHGSKLIAVAGHMDCAGNPIDSETKLEQIQKAVEVVRLWYPDTQVIGLFMGDDWVVREI